MFVMICLLVNDHFRVIFFRTTSQKPWAPLYKQIGSINIAIISSKIMTYAVMSAILIQGHVPSIFRVKTFKTATIYNHVLEVFNQIGS